MTVVTTALAHIVHLVCPGGVEIVKGWELCMIFIQKFTLISLNRAFMLGLESVCKAAFI